jgi:hypothetical protein
LLTGAVLLLQNSNLVLTLENRPRETGPTSEVTTLVGKVSVKQMMGQMGDRITHQRPAEEDSKKKKCASHCRPRIACNIAHRRFRFGGAQEIGQGEQVRR